jgi:hypothetical protein
MGLLDKTNPKTTRGSVIRHALISGVLIALAYLAACVWKPSLRGAWPIPLPAAALLGAAIGALMEWQLPDDSVEEDDQRLRG